MKISVEKFVAGDVTLRRLADNPTEQQMAIWRHCSVNAMVAVPDAYWPRMALLLHLHGIDEIEEIEI